ncbi:MAG: aminopeptidase [Deltaproteobacteria bacterium]|nr:aminopeptidase [Deltaproteobacteria bacterium]
MLTKAIRELYITNLAVKKNEKALVFTDTLLPDEDITEEDNKRRKALVVVARQVADVGMEICGHMSFLTYPSLRTHGSEPPKEIWAAAFGSEVVKELEGIGILEDLIGKKEIDEVLKRTIHSIIRENKADAVDVVIALSNFSTSHTKFRDEKRTNNLAACLGGAEKVFITAPNGTDIAIGIKGRKALPDTGNLTLPGSFGNLPAGEVFVAPVEGTTEGVLVLEWAPTFKLASPVTVKIENGLVKSVSGNDPYAKKLEAKLNENPDFRNVAELGIGTNDKAKRADNILESEKILGTIHIAFGDNSTFGGKVRTPFHQDFVIFNPTVKILKEKEEKIILKQGKLLAF